MDIDKLAREIRRLAYTAYLASLGAGKDVVREKIRSWMRDLKPGDLVAEI